MRKLRIIPFLAILLACFTSATLADSPPVHPIMHVSGIQKLDRFLSHSGLPHVRNAPLRTMAFSASGSKDLLPLVPYIGNDRDQGYCGNCWIWAGTGAIEVALRVQKGISTRLSVQYMNSNYNEGGTVQTRYGYNSSNFACDGGDETVFAEFYTGSESSRQFIPWSNTNASYADYYGGQAGGYGNGKKTSMPASSIATGGAYGISDLGVSMIPTFGVGQEQAIANIKAALDNNIALEFDFFLPNQVAWSAFETFWSSSSESAIFDYDPYSGVPYSSTGGGHAVLLVGYDDTDPDENNHYWKVLNSWGTTAQRPNGVFRVKMHMDYNNVDAGNSQNLFFEQFSPTFTNSGDPDPTPTAPPEATPTSPSQPEMTPTSTPVSEEPTPAPTATPIVELTPTPDPEEAKQVWTLTLSAHLKNVWKRSRVTRYTVFNGSASSFSGRGVQRTRVTIQCRYTRNKASSLRKSIRTDAAGRYTLKVVPRRGRSQRCVASTTSSWYGRIGSRSVIIRP